MGLVDYGSDSDSGSDGGPVGSVPPQLPDRLLDVYTTAPRTSDDPSFHQGRQRTFKHEDGKWPSHVYLQWVPRAEDAELISQWLELPASNCTIQSLVATDLGARKPLHISLSETLMIPAEKKQLFHDRVIEALALYSRLELSACQVGVFCNQTKSRAFIALLVEPRKEVSTMIEEINKIAADLQLPKLRSESPHMSVGSIDLLVDNRTSAEDLVGNKQADVEGLAQRIERGAQLDRLDIRITEVKVKIGRDVKTVELR